MEDKHFDQRIKDALEQFEANYNPQDWEAMSERLDLEETMESADLEDMYVDALAYGSLKDFEVPYVENDWRVMEAKLEEAFSFRRSVVYRYKLAEIGLMLLFIFTLFQYLPLQKDEKGRSAPVIADQAIVDKVPIASADQAATHFSEVPSDLSAQVEVSTLQPVSETDSPESFPAEDGFGSQRTPTHQNNTPDSGPASVNRSDILRSQRVLTHDQAQQLLSPVQRSLADPSPSAASETMASSDLRTSYLDVWGLSPLAWDQQSLSYDCVLCTLGERLTAIRVGMFATPDLNLIETPYDVISGSEAARIYAFGYGGGLSLGWEFSKWTFQTGLIYSAKTYQPFASIETYGNFDSGYVTEQFGKFELDVLQIPFELQYQINNSPKWRIYGLAGASLNTVIQGNYDRKVIIDSGFRSGRAGQGAGPSLQEIRAEESRIFADKELVNGFFEGGPLLRNTFITIQSGLGIERSFSSRWSFFLEPSFRYHLGSFSRFHLGPNRDKIHTGSLRLGTKVNLK